MKNQTKLIWQKYNFNQQDWHFLNEPVYSGSTVLFESYERMSDSTKKYIYGRWETPTVDAFCNKIAILEKGVASIATSSGLSAITSTLLALIKKDSHILISDSCYPTALNFCNNNLKKLGIKVEKFSLKDSICINKKVTSSTVLVFIDIPGSFGCDVFDIKSLKNQLGVIPLIVDNTWATPYNFNPLIYGADIVIHSVSKYISGYSDVIAGCIIFKDHSMHEKVLKYTREEGQYISGHQAYMASRGLKTLAVRITQHYKNALYIARWLDSNKYVEKVFFPPLKTNNSYKNWKKYFRGGSGLLFFLFNKELENRIGNFFNKLKIINLGWGWGGYESLVSYKKIDTGEYKGRIAVRLSVGLENAEDIKNDISNSINRLLLK